MNPRLLAWCAFASAFVLAAVVTYSWIDPPIKQ